MRFLLLLELGKTEIWSSFIWCSKSCNLPVFARRPALKCVCFPVYAELSSVCAPPCVSFAISPPGRVPVSFSDASPCASLRVRAVSPIRLILIVLLFACKFVAMLRMLFLFFFDIFAKNLLTVSSRRVRELCNSLNMTLFRAWVTVGSQWNREKNLKHDLSWLSY